MPDETDREIAAKPIERLLSEPASATATGATPRWPARRRRSTAAAPGVAAPGELPPRLPVMTALVECGMKNLSFGDADSIGLFQMRVSI